MRVRQTEKQSAAYVSYRLALKLAKAMGERQFLRIDLAEVGRRQGLSRQALARHLEDSFTLGAVYSVCPVALVEVEAPIYLLVRTPRNEDEVYCWDPKSESVSEEKGILLPEED